MRLNRMSSEIKERRIVGDNVKVKKEEEMKREVERKTFLRQRDNDRRTMCWRGVMVWGLTTMFCFMLSLLVVFLYLISRTPLTEEDLKICRESEFNAESDVIQLTQLNFAELTGQKDTSWLVELYSPYCSHCKRMRKAWEETATTLKEQGGFFKVGKVDCKCEVPVCRPFALHHYPGIYLIENGEIIQYDSKSRTKESFISWAQQVSSRFQQLGYEV